MKLKELKSIVKTAVKEAIQEELKEILLEAVRSPKQVIQSVTPTETIKSEVPTQSKQDIRESYQNILGDMGAKFTSNNVPSQPAQGLQVTGTVDTMSPSGKLPEGEVSMDQIVGLMNSK
tara:strand:+ start:37 stop:393 length:357 start_codon:yes stop_codon:yes gene_type:complete